MKCIIFSLLLAVALALPAPKPDDDSSNSLSSQQSNSDSRRSYLSSKSSSNDREDDDDDNSTYEKYSRSSDDDDDDDDSRSSSRSSRDQDDDDNYDSTERVAELSSYLDYLNDKYEGRGVLKVEYSPSQKKFDRYSKTHNLGSLHFSYHPPGKSYRSKNLKNYFVYSPMENSKTYKSKYQSMNSEESSSVEDQPYYKSKDYYKDYKPYSSSSYSSYKSDYLPYKSYKSRGYKKSLYSKSNSEDNFDDDESSSS